MGAIQGIFAAQYEVLRPRKAHTPSEAFNETVEELTQSLMPLVAENGMDWMYAQLLYYRAERRPGLVEKIPRCYPARIHRII